MKKFIIVILFFNSLTYCQYIEAGKEFGYHIRVNNLFVSWPRTFQHECQFVKNDSLFYIFRIDSFAIKYKEEYGEIKRFLDDMIKYKHYNLTEKEKSDFIEKLNDGVFTFCIFSNSIPLTFQKGVTYEIKGEVNPGWPSSYGLFIKRQNKYSFIGVSDWEINRTIELPKDFSLQISFSKVLDDKVKIEEDFTYTNLLHKYSYANQDIYLTQNEQSKLNEFIIYQGLSRKQEKNPGKMICDGGVNGISFIIIRSE